MPTKRKQYTHGYLRDREVTFQLYLAEKDELERPEDHPSVLEEYELRRLLGHAILDVNPR